MTDYRVSTTADLLKDVAIAKNGDRILLAAGTYSNVNIHDVIKSGVTITSADVNHQAVLTDLNVQTASGLNFSNLEMVVSKNWGFGVYNSQNITLDHLNVHGSLDGNPDDDFFGMRVAGSDNVSVTNSHFHELTDALTHLNDTNVKISGNTFDVIADNGVVGGGSSHIVVSNNTFTNFYHTDTVHPDAIQFWTTNTTTQASDITVDGNVFERCNGSVIQGIYIQDDAGKLPYGTVTVTNNTIIGGNYYGIRVNGAENVTLTGNTVIGSDGQQSWIALDAVTNATVTDNITTTLQDTNVAHLTSGGNVLATALADAQVIALPAPSLASASTSMLPTLGTRAVTAASAAATAALAHVNLTGFLDGASPTGVTYKFTQVQITGTSSNDSLHASLVGSSHLYGNAGNDLLVGSATGQPSIFEGGTGNDSYTIYNAKDTVIEKAGEGTDTIATYVDYTLSANVESMRAMVSGLTLHGNDQGCSLIAAAGGDTLDGGAGNDNLTGGTAADILYGENGNDTLSGNDGNDQLFAGSGNSVLHGGNGTDTLVGGIGNDTIDGGPGLDVMTGGKGADIFLYHQGDFTAVNLAVSKDIITDFNPAEGDHINLTMLDANAKTTTDEAFNFIGTRAFDGGTGELRYQAEDDGITVYGDTNGDKVADIAIHLIGLQTITASAFWL
jgi:parallel beta-helix repeat protein